MQRGWHVLLNMGITFLRQYAHISSWLDEKEVYYFFYKLCHSDLKCSKDSWDTVLANLFKLKDKLPWRFRNEIIAQAIKDTRQKEDFFLNKVKYRDLTALEYNTVDKLFQKTWKELVSFIKKEGVKLYQLNQEKIAVKGVKFIPPSILSKISHPKEKDLISVLARSKISFGRAVGKFVCFPKRSSDSKLKGLRHYIVITNNSSKETLIHEYMHYLQSLKNPTYCSAITEQANISQLFEKGKITRGEYESNIIRYKILTWKAEYEVYQHMAEKVKSSNLEKLNNRIQLLIYRIRLARPNDKKYKMFIPAGKIKFKVEDNLPKINILNGNLVLDLGAMDSVIRPALVFQHFGSSDLGPLKMKTVQNALGKKREAPFVVLHKEIQIDNYRVKNSPWLLANLKISNIDGVLGLSFFENRHLILYPKRKSIEIVEELKRPPDALKIQRDYDSQVQSVEFVCPQGLIVRLDSGSQVEGDMSNKLLPNVVGAFRDMKKGYQCGGLKIFGNFKSHLQNEVIFDRGVGLNVGWPWLAQFDRVTISLRDAWIHFSK